MAKQQTKSNPFNLAAMTIAVTIFLGLIAAVTWLAIERHSLLERVDGIDSQLASLSDEVGYGSLSRPAVLAKENKVAIPEFKITLPYDETTSSLRYVYDDNGYIRIFSTKVTDNEQRQLSCLDLVRLTTDSAVPNSPWEEHTGSVKLSDGRTMHIFAGKAYANNEASTLDCATEVWQDVTPQQIADLFAKAETY